MLGERADGHRRSSVSELLAVHALGVLSPHLDDAVFSLGSTIAQAAGRGAEVRVVTAFANDPDSQAPASEWDARCGFSSAAAAARARREEDRRACARIGAQPVWLPFLERQERGEDEAQAVGAALVGAMRFADAVLAPGFPLQNRDHAWLARLALACQDELPPLHFYVEQPYAAWSGQTPWEGPPPPGALEAGSWRRLSRSRGDAWRKAAASLAYRSQLKPLGRLVLLRVARYERQVGGECVTVVARAAPGEPERGNGQR